MSRLFLPLTIVLFGQLALAASLPSYSYDDYDFERYEQIYKDQERALTRGEQDLKERQESLRTVTQRYNEITARLNEKTERLNDLLKQDSSYPKIIQDLTEKLANRGELLKRAEENLRNKETDISSNQAQQQAVAKKITETKDSITQAEAKIKEIEATPDSPEKTEKLDQAKKQLAAAQAALQTAQSEQQTLVSRGQSLAREKQQLAAEIERAKKEVAEDTKRLEQMRLDVARIKQEIPKVQEEVRIISGNHQAVARDVEIRTRERDESARWVEGHKRQMNLTARRMEQINSNIEKAGQAIEADAETDGGADGRREGRELGQARGEAVGKTEGIETGKKEGIAAGQKRDAAAGYATGKAEATAAATKKAMDDAEINGKRDGTNLGTKEGLQAAYDEGWGRGQAAANDQAAYKAGRIEGEAEGLNDAKKDAAYRKEDGKKDRKNYYHSQPLKPVVMGKSLAKGFNGIQGRYSPSGDDKYYNPRPDSYPHPRLREFYMAKYDAIYMSELEASHKSAYDSAKASAFAEFRRITKDEYEKKDYPESRKAGREKGWNDAYNVVYNNIYGDENSGEYGARLAKYRKIAFDANKNDQGQKDKGYREGNAYASKEKGKTEGHKYAYDKNIDIEKDLAYKAGVKEIDDRYMNNPVLEMSDITLLEDDQDSIFRPGEGVQAQIKLKNFGLVGKTGLLSAVSNAKGINITQPQTVLGEIQAQSDTTITVAIQGQVKIDAKENEALSLQVDLKDGLKVLMNKTFAKVAQMPTKVVIANFDGILIPGVATPVKLVVTNKSSKVQNLDISLSLDNSRVSADKLAINVANLGAGQASEQMVTLTGKPDAQFEESPLKISTAQGANVFAADVNLNMTIIQRHTPTADSSGLIISGNLAQGGGKAMFASAKLDTWDLRVDGALKANSLDSYLNKVVNIMADAKANLDAASLGVITQFIQAKKGTVILWGSRAHESGIAKQLANLVGAANLSNTYINESLKGAGILNGLMVNYNGNATVMTAADSLSQMVLPKVAVRRIVDGIADRMGLAVLVGLEPSALTAAELSQIPAYAKMHNQSFEQKMQASKTDVSQVQLVVAEMMAELQQVEINRSERHYRDKGKSSKIGKALNKYLRELGEKAAPTQEFVRHYPTVANYINGMKNTIESFQADQVMNSVRTSGLLGKTWKDLWCNKNGNDKLCRHEW